MSDTCSLFPPFGDPWPSCLSPLTPTTPWCLYPVSAYLPDSWRQWSCDLLVCTIQEINLETLSLLGNAYWVHITCPGTELDTGQNNQFCNFRQWYRPWRITWVREREREDNHFRSDVRRILTSILTYPSLRIGYQSKSFMKEWAL